MAEKTKEKQKTRNKHRKKKISLGRDFHGFFSFFDKERIDKSG